MKYIINKINEILINCKLRISNKNNKHTDFNNIKPNNTLDFSNVNLSHADLADVNLSNLTFDNVNLTDL